jgi:hypothetical protein
MLLESLAAETTVQAREVGDVASATQNTFKTDNECVEQICADKPHPLDEVEPSRRQALRHGTGRFSTAFNRSALRPRFGRSTDHSQ